MGKKNKIETIPACKTPQVTIVCTNGARERAYHRQKKDTGCDELADDNRGVSATTAGQKTATYNHPGQTHTHTNTHSHSIAFCSLHLCVHIRMQCIRLFNQSNISLSCSYVSLAFLKRRKEAYIPLGLLIQKCCVAAEQNKT